MDGESGGSRNAETFMHKAKLPSGEAAAELGKKKCLS